MSRCPVFYLNSTSKSQDGGSLAKPDTGTQYGSYLYWNSSTASGKWVAEEQTVHLGIDAGRYNPGIHIVAIGANAGTNGQSDYAVAIGDSAGNVSQGANSVAIGLQSGQNHQGANAVAIGLLSGQNYQSNSAVAIGSQSGQNDQGANAVAIGQSSGALNQGTNSVAIGQSSGALNQGQNSVAIGPMAGAINQGENSVAIGPMAGATGQSSNSIIINAGITGINSYTPGVFINPIRGPFPSGNVLSYNTTTCEVFYNGSSERYKYDIVPLSADTSAVYNLQPREFKYKLNDAPDIGLIAEEAFQCDPAFVYLDKDLIPEGIQWNTITTYLISEFKKLKMEIEEMETLLSK